MPRSSPRSQPIDSHLYEFEDVAVAVTLHEPTGPVLSVPETLVQDLWAHQQFSSSALRTTDGQPVRVVDPGQLNADSGADFTEAHLRIGDLDWHGDVEIHTTSGAWFDHEHHLDSRYNSVVLHVTLYADQWTGGLLRENDSPIPEVVLYPHLDQSLRSLLRDFYLREDAPIPCAPQWTDVPASKRQGWIRQLGRQRLLDKKTRLADRYAQRPNLEALLHERLFAGLGYAKNDEPMAELAERIPLSIARQWDDPADREALHFGVAGLLPAPGDLLDADRPTADYVMDLRRRFRRIRSELEMSSMNRERWSFFRLRPANFPPLRIAQGVALFNPGRALHHDPIGALVSAVESDAPFKTIRTLLRAHPTDFWKRHVRLETSSAPHNPQIGRTRIDTLVVNAVLPLLLLYAEQHERPGLSERVFTILDEVPPDRDSVTRIFADLGARPPSALESQGMHHLYRTYCTDGGCLQCAIGQHLLRSGQRTKDQADE